MTHTFQVGDRVRHVAWDDGKAYSIERIEGHLADLHGVVQSVNLCDLVKIHLPQEERMEPQEDAIELGLKHKIVALESQVKQAKYWLEKYQELKVFINQEDHHGTR